MDKNEKLPINIKIIDRTYPLKVDRAEEERIRKAARIITDKVLQYQSRYNSKDNQDLLSMAALQFVVKVLEYEEKIDVSDLLDELKDINSELNDFLVSEKKSSLQQKKA